MNKKVAIIDYGVGNIMSLKRGIEYFGHEAIVTTDSKILLSCSHIFLPGDGAFNYAMKKIESKNLNEIIRKCVKKGNYLIGICLGMQMLFEKSFEKIETNGLGLLQGNVEIIPKKLNDNVNIKVPHIGWNKIYFDKDKDFFLKNKYLDNSSPYVYFIHSYYCNLGKDNQCLAYADYNSFKIPSIVSSRNIYGCQFHPEKSGKFGLDILRAILNLN